MATFLHILCLYIKSSCMNELLQNNYSMELLTQPINQNKVKRDKIFSKRSRESYFAMMEVAHKNLAMIDEGEKKAEILLKKPV